jgi:hypothetical protein
LQTLNHQPATFVVLDVSTNLSCHTWIPKEVKVIILGRGQKRRNEEAARQGRKEVAVVCPCLSPSYLNLKELSHLQQDLLGIVVFLLTVNACLQGKGLRNQSLGVGREKDVSKIHCKHICNYHNVSPCTIIIC